jgi:hypothetical protein
VEPAPFNTQFFHDDYDDDGPGFDDMDPYDGDGARSGEADAEEDLLAATAGESRRVRPQYVNYAKRAKRVDVRKLKDNIWKGLDIVVTEQDEHSMVNTTVPLSWVIAHDESRKLTKQGLLPPIHQNHGPLVRLLLACRILIRRTRCQKLARVSALYACYTLPTNKV